MSNKTQLQTNNAKLDNIITLVDEAKDIAASLPEAGGSGGESVEIGTFSLGEIIGSGSSPLQIFRPFIIGQTWEEYINSPLNIYVFSTAAPNLANRPYIANNQVITYSANIGGPGIVSTKLNTSGAVKPSDLIIDGFNYLLSPSIDFPM